jgi:hypothetical protein
VVRASEEEDPVVARELTFSVGLRPRLRRGGRTITEAEARACFRLEECVHRVKLKIIDLDKE